MLSPTTAEPLDRGMASPGALTRVRQTSNGSQPKIGCAVLACRSSFLSNTSDFIEHMPQGQSHGRDENCDNQTIYHEDQHQIFSKKPTDDCVPRCCSMLGGAPRKASRGKRS